MRYRREATLLAVSIAVSLLLGELALRLFYVVTYSGSIEDLRRETRPPAAGSSVRLGDMLRLSRSPRLVYELIPGLDVRFLDTRVETGPHGWRDQLLPRAKAAGDLRVVGLGDSVMFGWGVEERERYLDRLEERLNRSYPERRWQALALAAPGYNLVMEVEALKEQGADLLPDLIVYGYSANDFCLPNFVRHRQSIWSRRSFLRLYLAGGPGGPELLERDGAVESAGGESRAGAQGAAFFATYCSPAAVPAEYGDLVGADSFLESMRELAAIGRERGAPVVLLHHGVGQGYHEIGGDGSGAPPPIARALSEAARLDGVIAVDLTAELQELFARGTYRRADLLLGQDDPHPSPEGHELIARIFERRLVELGVVEDLLTRRK